MKLTHVVVLLCLAVGLAFVDSSPLRKVLRSSDSASVSVDSPDSADSTDSPNGASASEDDSASIDSDDSSGDAASANGAQLGARLGAVGPALVVLPGQTLPQVPVGDLNADPPVPGDILDKDAVPPGQNPEIAGARLDKDGRK